MGINLIKGQNIDLRKGGATNEASIVEYDLSNVTIGLGWDVSRIASGDYDLDAVAVLLDANGKVRENADVIYYGNKQHRSGKIWSTGDNLTGAGEGDDEQIIVKLEELDQKYEKIVFFASIYRGIDKGQHFGMVENAFIRAVDGFGKEIARYNISANPDTNNKRSLVFCEVYRWKGAWKMKAIGEALDTDSLTTVVERYK
jgi:tellurium resistance protein TerD